MALLDNTSHIHPKNTPKTAKTVQLHRWNTPREMESDRSGTPPRWNQRSRRKTRSTSSCSRWAGRPSLASFLGRSDDEALSDSCSWLMSSTSAKKPVYIQSIALNLIPEMFPGCKLSVLLSVYVQLAKLLS